MEMIPRILSEIIPQKSKKGFVNIVYGPRRVGKTFLLKQISENLSEDDTLWLNGDAKEDQDLLKKTSAIHLEDIVKHVNAIVIDEAQRIPNISLSLKILVDNHPEKTIYATGSSSLLLSKGIRETLTGRTQVYNLYPLSTQELAATIPPGRAPTLLDSQLLYGGYPYVRDLTTDRDRQEYLRSIVDDYLFREILYLKDVSSPENLRKLATLLSFQIGSEVSLNELADAVGIDVKTVKRYISLLEDNFIIFSVGGYSNKLKEEVSQSKKYYFWDLGIRNAVIDQFLPLEVRTDTPLLWENFLAVERIKMHEYTRESYQYYFWRTYNQAEIDWLEEKQLEVEPYEFSWTGKVRKDNTPKAFRENYGKKVTVISQENYLRFVCEEEDLE